MCENEVFLKIVWSLYTLKFKNNKTKKKLRKTLVFGLCENCWFWKISIVAKNFKLK